MVELNLWVTESNIPKVQEIIELYSKYRNLWEYDIDRNIFEETYYVYRYNIDGGITHNNILYNIKPFLIGKFKTCLEMNRYMENLDEYWGDVHFDGT